MASRLIVSLKKQSGLCGSSVNLRSPAKINLYLNILGKYPSGFHQIESIVERISLCDVITVTAVKDDMVRVICNKKELENQHNLCYRAAALVKKTHKIKTGFTITLKKNIPIGAGLGGGSSNAAATLIGINALLGFALNKFKLYQLGSQLGSDVNFFIAESSYALIRGRGEEVIPFQGKRLRHIVIWPAVSLSTKKVYQHAHAKLTKFLNNVKMIQFALERGNVGLLDDNIFNALEKPALSICKRLKQARQILFNKGVFAHVTGSGSALYTVLGKVTPDYINDSLPRGWFVYEACTF